MTFPLGYQGPVSGLLLGIVFGYVLENAGFGSGCKLTAQLRFQDWAVFQVMFTAIVVASGGLYLLQALGMVDIASDLFVPSVYLWGSSLGGALIGVGMAVGGYCPGTSLVALCSGRVDGLVFVAGLMLGTLGFNSVYSEVRDWVWRQSGPDALTLPQLLHLPAWAVWGLLLGVLAAVSYLTRGSVSSTQSP